MVLNGLLRRLVKVGRLTLIDAGGGAHVFDGGTEGPHITVRLHTRAVEFQLLLKPQLYTGKAFVDGTLTIENGSIYDFLDFVGMNLKLSTTNWVAPPGLFRWPNAFLRYLRLVNSTARARRNAAHHYDLSDALYGLFLDSDRQYSCGYFIHPDDDLETAQTNKKHHIAAKLLIEPGQRVLDIGSGWGGLALYLARQTGARVTGITLSTEQLAYSRRRAREEGLADRVHFFLSDYREQTGTFERIVSVGMFEHVGVDHYRRFFGHLMDMLSEDGIALIHTIGRQDAPAATNPWLRKYIFPGIYNPALSEIMAAIEPTGALVTDIEVLRVHYAETLRHWRRRFLANRRQAAELYDERFCRMWEFYLAGCEVTFRYMASVVFQIQLARHQEAVPLTRDYVTDYEQSLRHGAEEGLRAMAH